MKITGAFAVNELGGNGHKAWSIFIVIQFLLQIQILLVIKFDLLSKLALETSWFGRDRGNWCFQFGRNDLFFFFFFFFNFFFIVDLLSNQQGQNQDSNWGEAECRSSLLKDLKKIGISILEVDRVALLTLVY